MPAFIPFMLAGLFAIVSGSAVLTAAGLDGSQSKKSNTSTGSKPSTVTQRSNQPRSSGPAPAPATTTSSSGSKSSPAPAPVAAAPAPAPAPTPAPEPPKIPKPDPPPTYKGVKAAPIDTVIFVDEPYDPNFFEDVLFQDFGGQELLSIARSDTVNGQSVSYQPFKDLGIIRDKYTPNSLLGIQETSDRFFANFLIRLNEKIPPVGSGPNGSNFYFDLDSGDGIIELINIESNEQVEIQILNAGIIEDIGI